jgi:hypothetical protein
MLSCYIKLRGAPTYALCDYVHYLCTGPLSALPPFLLPSIQDSAPKIQGLESEFQKSRPEVQGLESEFKVQYPGSNPRHWAQ